ncbi:MAG: gliding motility-associated C-terminal domain-containing protein [Opitutaceae bacterium]|nr:gliding motility-associated C-terminal domain-containing protein [Cytophagales bacterium]
MSEETNIWPQIERYLSGMMNKSEKADFEKNTASDPDLADMVESYKLTEFVVVSNESQKLKSIMEKDLSGKKIALKTIVLSGILVAGIGFGIYLMNPIVDKENGSSIKPIIVAEKQSSKSIIIFDSENTKTTVEEATKNPKTSLIENKKTEKNETPILEQTTISPIEYQKHLLEDSAKIESKGTKGAIVKSISSPCENLNIEADFYSAPPCSGKSNGEIHLQNKSIKGGIAPYKISVDNEVFVTNNIKDLNAGSYEVFIKDGNNCIAKISELVFLKSISCNESSKEFTFNPQYDPALVFPYNNLKNAKTLRILDKWGKEVFFSQVNAGQPADWNGESNTGSHITAGYYLFYIEYTDGTTDKGSISILR